MGRWPIPGRGLSQIQERESFRGKAAPREGRLLEAAVWCLDLDHENHSWFCILDCWWVADSSVVQTWTDFGTLISECPYYLDFAKLTQTRKKEPPLEDLPPSDWPESTSE